MKEILFLLADLWMIFAGFFYGWKFIRRYDNYLLGLEWIVVAASGVNFLVWSLLGSAEDSFQYPLAYFLDAFSRSVGITLILVLGLMRVTHRYKPSVAVDVGVFALATAAGLYLQQFRHGFYAGPATFYLVVNVLTTVFLAYFTWRLWRIAARGTAIGTALVSAAGTAIAVTYDFFPIPGDDSPAPSSTPSPSPRGAPSCSSTTSRTAPCTTTTRPRERRALRTKRKVTRP